MEIARTMTQDEFMRFAIMEKMTVEYINDNSKTNKLYRNSHTHGLEIALNGWNLSCLLNVPADKMNAIYNAIAYEILKDKDKYLSKRSLKNPPTRMVKLSTTETMYFKLVPTKCFGEKSLRIIFSDKNKKFPPNCDSKYMFQSFDIDVEPDENK